MKKCDRSLPPNSASKETFDKDDQKDFECIKLQRGFSFHQAKENQPNFELENYDIKETKNNIFMNSQEISSIYGENASAQEQPEPCTIHLSSIRRSEQESNKKSKNKIKLLVSDFQIGVIDGFLKQLKLLNILNNQSRSLFPTKQLLNIKNLRLRIFEQKVQISLEAQNHLIKEIQINQNSYYNNRSIAKFKAFFSQNKSTGPNIKNKLSNIKEVNQEIQHYVYDIKFKTVLIRAQEVQITSNDPKIDQQKKRLLEEQMAKESKPKVNQDKPMNQKQVEQKFNLDFTKLYQKVDQSLIHHNNMIQQTNMPTPFIMSNQIFQNTNIFQNNAVFNPFQNSFNNSQQGYIQTNSNPTNNSNFTVKNSSDQIKTRSYNTRSRMN